MQALYSYSMVEPANRLDLKLRQEGDDYHLEIRTGTDEVGVLFRLCAVLFANGCDIRYAGIGTEEGMVHDEFRIRSQESLTEGRVQSMMADLRKLLFEGVSVLDYLRGRSYLPEPVSAGGEVSITTSGGAPAIEVITRDQRGLLLTLSQAFYLMDINIAEARITTDDSGRVRNTFRVRGPDARFQNAEFRRRLGEELTGIL